MREDHLELSRLQAVKAIFDEAGVPCVLVLEAKEKDSTFDAEVVLKESGARLCLDYHPALAPIQFNTVAGRLLAALPKGTQGGLVVRRLSLTLLDACKARGLCCFGLDGNAYVRMPGVYVERYRPAAEAQRVPSAGTCFTAKASRLVRAFFARYPHDSMQAELAKSTGLSRGYVSILVGRLVNDGYVSNNMDLVYLVEPDRLLDAWAAHYRFDRHARSYWALTMNTYEQGLEKLAGALQAQGVTYAHTGWSGAYLRAPYTSTDTLMAYVNKVPESLAGVYRTEKQGNVILIVPQDEGVFQFANPSDYGAVVSDAQLYIDLSRMPGRAREQADALRHERLNFGGKLNGR
jgi:hypothetical protein